MKYVIVLTCCLLPAIALNSRTQKTFLEFPDDFMFGAATSSFQAEGAWNIDGKSLSMWDYSTFRNPGLIADRSNATVACNSYYLYKRDIEMLKELGVKVYRFSISWPRILPSGRPDYVNPLGVAHYNAIIDELIANDIVPFVTIYHWDLPQTLSERGGWLNEEIVDWFGDYARVLYQNFGDRVKYWLTINEPYIHCWLGYATGIHAPEVKSPGVGFYECGRHILLANARAYHIYNEEFRTTQNGQVGVVFNLDWPESATNSDDDADAALSYIAMNLGQYADPIFSEHGNYPQILIDQVASASASQGYNASRLRPFTDEQIKYIKGTSDFFAINTYGTYVVYRNESVEGMYEIPSLFHDGYFGAYSADFMPMDGSHDIREYVPGFYKLLMYIKEKYNNPVVYITENGLATNDMTLVDDDRVTYIRNYLTALLAAKADGANVQGYVVWNLMDDFQWNFGYTRTYCCAFACLNNSSIPELSLLRLPIEQERSKMGLYQVDMTDPNRTRVPRKSAYVYKEIIRSRVIDYSYDPFEDNASSILKPSLHILLLLYISLVINSVFSK